MHFFGKNILTLYSKYKLPNIRTDLSSNPIDRSKKLCSHVFSCRKYLILKSEILQTFVIKKKLLHNQAKSARITIARIQNTITFVMGQKLTVYWKVKKNAILIQTVLVLCTEVTGMDHISREWLYAGQRHWLQRTRREKNIVFISSAMKVNFESLKRAH